MKPRIKFDASDSTRSRMTYYLQAEMMGGFDGAITVKKAEDIGDDSKIDKAHRKMLIKILAIPGIRKLEVQNTELGVVKAVAAEWLDDGIHQAVIDILKLALHPGAEVEVVSLPDSDFPKEGFECPGNSSFVDDPVLEMITDLLGGTGSVVSSVEINFRINFREGK